MKKWTNLREIQGLKGETIPRVYALDHEVDFLENLKALVSETNVDVITFTEPKEFLSEVQKSQPDLCIIHSNAAGEGVGLLAVQAIRKVIGKKLRVLLVSGGGDLEKQAKETGADSSLKKPFGKEEFEKKLSEFFELKQEESIHLEEPAVDSGLKTFSEFNAPKGIDKFYEAVAPIFAEIFTYLENEEELDRRVEFYLEALKEYEEIFVKMINSMRSGDDEIDLEQCIRTYGIPNVRVLFSAIKLKELTTEGGFEWDPEACRPKVPAEEIVVYAKKCVEHFGEDSRYQYFAFACGLVYDVCLALNDSIGDGSKAVVDLLDECFERGLKVADESFKIGKTRSKLALEKHVVTTAMLAQIGQVLMAILFEGYLELLKKLKDAEIPLNFYPLIEEKKYSVTHGMLSALICHVNPDMREAYRSLPFFNRVFLMKGENNQGLYDLTSTCGAASVAVSSAKS